MRLTLTAALVTASVAAAGCTSSIRTAPPGTVTHGDPARGRAAIDRHGCASCHSIPGVRRAEVSYLAPPLDRFRRRAFIAGSLPNTLDNLALWLLDPQAVEPGTAMPDVGLSRREADDIAAYLHTLE